MPEFFIHALTHHHRRVSRPPGSRSNLPPCRQRILMRALVKSRPDDVHCCREVSVKPWEARASSHPRVYLGLGIHVLIFIHLRPRPVSHASETFFGSETSVHSAPPHLMCVIFASLVHLFL